MVILTYSTSLSVDSEVSDSEDSSVVVSSVVSTSGVKFVSSGIIIWLWNKNDMSC